jgi:hypothetical protein
MKTHTATPWISDGYNVRQPSGRHIAHTGPSHTPANEYPASCRLEDEANARHIVKAVNCHDELVAFAEWAMDQFTGDSGTGDNYWQQFPEFVKGRVAIAKAKLT